MIVCESLEKDFQVRFSDGENFAVSDTTPEHGGSGEGFKPAAPGAGQSSGPMVSDEDIAASSRSPDQSNAGSHAQPKPSYTLMGKIGGIGGR